jgi:hypothetical protein
VPMTTTLVTTTIATSSMRRTRTIVLVTAINNTRWQFCRREWYKAICVHELCNNGMQKKRKFFFFYFVFFFPSSSSRATTRATQHMTSNSKTQRIAQPIWLPQNPCTRKESVYGVASPSVDLGL